MTEDAKRILHEFFDGEPFGITTVCRLLKCRKARAGRALRSLVTAGMARRAPGNDRIYKLTALGRDLGEAQRQLKKS
ncbi:hypothetical protein [Candidatus Palauibacter sp.]|uniref:hypothetical protein n=1 Tax=Candidatus Palauibacter sp. TaxID=3101350 RepID=UPI003B02A83F